MDGQYWKGEPCQQTSGCWHLTFDSFLNLDMGDDASCTDNIYDLENERWLLGDMIDHVGIYGSRVAKGLSAFSVGLVFMLLTNVNQFFWILSFSFTLSISSDIDIVIVLQVWLSFDTKPF